MVVIVTGCSAFTEPGGERDWLGTSTVSPIPGAVAFTPPASYSDDYRTARDCITANGGRLRRQAPTFAELRWYATPDSTFYTGPIWPYDYGIGPLVGYAHGHTITLSSRGRDLSAVIQHEIAHLFTGAMIHDAPFWSACGWITGGYETVF